MRYIIEHHPRFKEHDIPVWLDRDFKFNIEGGDELVLNDETVAIGVSERSTAQAIERLVRNLFKRQDRIRRGACCRNTEDQGLYAFRYRLYDG